MTDKPLRNLAASVRQRLTNLSRQKDEDFQLLLTRYCIERLLYRLSLSEHSRQFVLKGAMLFSLWSDQPYRPTRDLDLLGTGDKTVSHLRKVFRDVCKVKVEDDGVAFDPESVQAAPIRDEQDYGEVRVELVARLAQARLPTQRAVTVRREGTLGGHRPTRRFPNASYAGNGDRPNVREGLV
jgi:hypothetical protein